MSSCGWRIRVHIQSARHRWFGLTSHHPERSVETTFDEDMDWKDPASAEASFLIKLLRGAAEERQRPTNWTPRQKMRKKYLWNDFLLLVCVFGQLSWDGSNIILTSYWCRTAVSLLVDIGSTREIFSGRSFVLIAAVSLVTNNRCYFLGVGLLNDTFIQFMTSRRSVSQFVGL